MAINDPAANLVRSTVATAPNTPSAGTTLVVANGDGTTHFSRIVGFPYDLSIWPAGAVPTLANTEIVTVTGRSVDTLTIVRAQQGTTARTVLVGDQIEQTVTARMLAKIGSHTSYFADASLGTGNGTAVAQTIPAGAFTTVTLDTENSDVDNVFASSVYTVPKTGLYQCLARVRTVDASSAGRNFGLGIHTSNGDGVWFAWGTIPASVNRNTIQYARTAFFTAGQQLRLYAYSDGGTLPINNANMTVAFIGEQIT